MTFLEKNIARFTRIINNSIFSQTINGKKGFLQELDARTKIICFVVVLVSVNLAQNLYFIFAVYFLLIALAALSRIPVRYFIFRVWLFLPFFTGIIALPAIFNLFTPGKSVFNVLSIEMMDFSLYITDNGLRVAFFLLSRVAVSVSLSILLVTTTDWVKLMKALDKFGMPKTIILILLMTYRYIFVLLQTADDMLLARRSRMTARLTGSTGRIWAGSFVGVLFDKTHMLSQEAANSMRSRGFNNKIHILDSFSYTSKDYFALAGTAVTVVLLYFIFR